METLTLEEIEADEINDSKESISCISRNIVIAPDGTVCYIETTMQDFDRRYRQR